MLRYAAVVLGTLTTGFAGWLALPAAAGDSAHGCPRNADASRPIQGWSVVVPSAGGSPASAERLLTCVPTNVLVIAPTPDRNSVSLSRSLELR